MHSRSAFLAVASAALLFSGCYTGSPQLWETSVENYTFVSTSARPITITLVDTRDESEFFRTEIPVGQQLSIHFEEGSGDDPVKRPAKLQWSLVDAGTGFASLTNSLSCPPMFARRIDYSLRPSGESAPQPPQAPMRVEATESPAWVTPAGGPPPTSNAKKLYE